MDGQCQANLCYSTTHSLLHFELFKVATVSQIPYVFQLLCVCYRLSLTLDVVSLMSCTKLYEQSIFCINDV